jgi:hypothetical protein
MLATAKIAETPSAAAAAYPYRQAPRVLLGFRVLCAWCRAFARLAPGPRAAVRAV